MIAHAPFLELVAMPLAKMMYKLVLVGVGFFAAKIAKEWFLVWEFCLVERNETKPVDDLILFT
jgi:hypothetical protein